MSAVNERYYAIRIGDPRSAYTYLALDHGNKGGAVPALYIDRKQAAERRDRLAKENNHERGYKVVRVRITAR